jgi:hypothetical protein
VWQARPGEEEGRGGGREKGRGGENSPLGIQISAISTPNPRAPRGEREVEEREGGYYAGEIKWDKWIRGREGARAWGGQGVPGARGLDRAGLGLIADRNPRHARPLNGIQSRTGIRNRTRRTRDIRQRNALRHDATPMTLRFCLYMTRTPVTILVRNWEEGAKREEKRE